MFVVAFGQVLRHLEAVFVAADAAHNAVDRHFLGVYAVFLEYLLEQGFLGIGIVDAEVWLEGQVLVFHAEDAQAERVEGAHPEAAYRDLEQRFQPLLQLIGRFVCEGDHQDVPRLDVHVLDQIGAAVDDGARLAAARTGQNQERTLGIAGYLQLLRIELSLKVYLHQGY